MYKIELIEQDKIIESKEFLKFDDIFTYSSILLKELTLNSKGLASVFLRSGTKFTIFLMKSRVI